MQNVLILLDNLDEWKPYYETKSIITATDYLQEKHLSAQPNLVINLSSDITYNSEGYYCSLLAQARGHKILPSAEVINKINSGTFSRLEPNLHKLVVQWVQRNNIDSESWELDIYFGTCVELGLEKVARYIFEQLPAPLLRVTFNSKDKTMIERIVPRKLSELSEEQQDLFANALDNFNRKIWRNPRSKKPPRYDLAIFHNPNEAFPPSNKKALAKFVELARKMNINAELITEDDIARLMEFDALFIRSTTSLNHVTYQLAQKAKQADMVVIDDPLSIIRCTNKVYLKELLDKEGIPSPKSTLIFRASEDNYNEICNDLGTPFILKIPDGSFSHGVKKVNTQNEFNDVCLDFFQKSAIILAQEYLPTDYDWRIGVLNGEPLYACKYYMVKGHWQIYYHQNSGKSKSGMSETIPIYQVPKPILRNAIRATSHIGKGLYGVDMKMVDGRGVVIEINDNPNIDFGVEDTIMGDEIYYRILREFVRALEQKHH